MNGLRIDDGQRMPRYARWEPDAARDDIRAYAVEHLAPTAVS
ncbi:hypothetical protein [Streptomyces sp. NPDC058812]